MSNVNINLTMLLLSGITLCSMSLAADATDNMQAVGDLLFDRTEVSIADFSAYVEATNTVTAAEKNGGGLVYDAGWQRMPGWNWRTPFGEKANPTLPAVHINFDEASAYCHWAGKRLPTDEEWHRAAYTESRSQPDAPFKTGQSYPYPTGMTPTGANCLGDCGDTKALDVSAKLSRGIGPAPVGSSAIGVNGLYDMGANVWEWTETEDDTNKGTRGGSWWYGAKQMEREHRATKARDMSVVYIGFRCVKAD